MAQPLVALCHSGVKVKDAQLENITFNELLTHFECVETGTKDGSYFLRASTVDAGKGRSDANTASTSGMLILDADSTAHAT